MPCLQAPRLYCSLSPVFQTEYILAFSLFSMVVSPVNILVTSEKQPQESLSNLQIPGLFHSYPSLLYFLHLSKSFLRVWPDILNHFFSYKNKITFMSVINTSKIVKRVWHLQSQHWNLNPDPVNYLGVWVSKSLLRCPHKTAGASAWCT